MTRDQFIAALQAEFTLCIEISRRKNSDYGGSSDPFRNFRAAALLGIPNDSAILVRMSDKMARIGTLLEKARKGEAPAVTDESLEDTLRDLANYALILLLFLRSERGSATPAQASQPSTSPSIISYTPRESFNGDAGL